MFGPDGFGGMEGRDGEITGLGAAKVAIIARWNIRRTGTNAMGGPKLRFQAWFSWKSELLMKFCSTGQMKGRVRVFMMSSKGKEQIDIVDWDEWRVDEDGKLVLENIRHFETAPLRQHG